MSTAEYTLLILIAGLCLSVIAILLLNQEEPPVTYLNTPDDCEWLRETHLKGLNPPRFNSAALYGNEDCPREIELYDSSDPLYIDQPVRVYVLSRNNTYVVRH